MPVFQTLYYAYIDAGLVPLTGYNPWHLHNWRDAPFTVFLQGNEEIRATDQGGLALQEVMFLENLGTLLSPKNCLIIGNAFGWSTVATALTFRGAKTVGMDNFPVNEGLDLTNRIFKKLDLDGTAVMGESPKDVAGICDEYLDGPLDFVLVDADHTNEALVADFWATKGKASSDCVYLFHDVLNFNMVDGFSRILKESHLDGRLLTKTPSGMAIAYEKDKVSRAFIDYLEVFSDDLKLYQGYRKLAEETTKGRNPFLLYNE